MHSAIRAAALSAVVVAACAAGVTSTAVAQAAPGDTAGVQAARGYVTQGNLRRDPNLSAPVIVTIYDQWVDINCWIDAGPNGFGSNRWFKATYYANVGYLSSGVVSQQPSVGHC